MDEVKIFEHKWTDKNGQENKMTILWGGMRAENPIGYMNDVVTKYVANTGMGYNEYVEITMDNPWIRVIIRDINNINFDDFKNQKLND